VLSPQDGVTFVDRDSHHQIASHDAAAHSVLTEKGQTTEHLPFGEIPPIAQRSADAVREMFVVRHEIRYQLLRV
jgi:hypothetical protein